LVLTGCAASGDRRATEDVGPVSAYARNTLAEENPAGLIRIGEGFERSGDFVGARKLYAQALAADPNLMEAEISYARASSMLGLNDEATAVLTLLLAKYPDNRQAKTTLAQVHASAARHSAALSVLETL
jgi:Flp pilus assembly protein TadD